MLGVKFEYVERVYESVGHSQPRGRRADCISGVCVRARPGARRQGQMDRKDSHDTCGQGRALAERPWDLGQTGPAREGPSIRHQGTGRPSLLGRDDGLRRRGEDRRTVHRLTGKDYKSFVFADTDGFWNGQVDGGDVLSFRYMHTNSKSTVVSCSQVKRTR